jgi:hypothetical protein
VSRGKQARAQARRSEPATFPTHNNAAYPGNSLDLRVQNMLGCMTTVLAHLMAAPKLNDCAVIGSSDMLRLEPQGELINRHQTIWRINNAPVEGFEHQVGNRTDVRFVNSVLIRVWNGNQKVKKGEGRIPPEKEFDPRLCTGREKCYLHASGSIDRALVRNPKKGSALAEIPHNLDLIPANTLEDLKICLGHRALGASSLSGGHAAVLAALRMCTGRVHLYGFMGECCEQGRPWLPQQNYKYHHTRQSKWVCCDRGREATQQVMGLFFLLEERGLLEIHMKEPLKTLIRNESQQHRRYKWMRVFSQPDLAPPGNASSLISNASAAHRVVASFGLPPFATGGRGGVSRVRNPPQRVKRGAAAATTSTGASGMDAVRAALAAIGMARYANAFEEFGYDDLPFLLSMGPEKLRQVGLRVGMKIGHAERMAEQLAAAAAAAAAPR